MAPKVPHSTWPPAVLPRIRDRLAVLLYPDHILSTLDGRMVRDQLAAGLPMARLYAIDDTFTVMAVAAAPSLHAGQALLFDPTYRPKGAYTAVERVIAGPARRSGAGPAGTWPGR